MLASRRFLASVVICILYTASVRGDALSQWFPRSFSNPICCENYSLSDIIFANGLFVAVGEYGDHGVVLTSRDGVTWKYNGTPSVFGPFFLSVKGIAYGNGRFVGAGWWGTSTLSLDGTNWSQGSIGSDTDFVDVEYGGGQFIAVGYGFSNPPTNTAFSTNGVNWTLRRGVVTNLNRVAYGDGVFLAVGPQGAVKSMGANWTIVSNLPFEDIVFGNRIFVLTGATNQIFTRTPSETSLPAFQSVTNLDARTLAFANGIFFAVNANGSLMFTSTNGTNWIGRDIDPPLSLTYPSGFSPRLALAQGANTLVAVRYPNSIAQSSPLARIGAGPGQGNLLISGIVGASYGVQARATFHTNSPWVPVGSVILTNSPQLWQDPVTSNEVQFYRTALLP